MAAEGTAGVIPVDFNLNAQDSFKDMLNATSSAAGGNIRVGNKSVDSGAAGVGLLKISLAAAIIGIIYYTLKGKGGK